MQNNEAMNEHANPLSMRVWLLFALSGGLLLRLLRLGSKSLWFDEAHGFNVAQQGMADFWNRGIEPVHPPFFFFLLDYWSRLGTSEFSLRLLSAISSFLALVLFFFICKKLFNYRVALTVTLLSAVNPLLIWYAQELRNYSLMLLLGTISSLAILMTVTSKSTLQKVAWFVLFALATAGLAYTHYGTMFFFYFQLAGLLMLMGIKKLPNQAISVWIAGMMAALAIYWPWLRSPVGSAFYERLFSGQRVANFPILYRPLPGFSTPILDLIQTLAPLLILLVTILPGAIYLLSHSDRVQQLVTRLGQQPWIRMAVYALLCLIIIAFTIPRAFTVKRHLVVFIPFLLIPIGLLWPTSAKNLRWLAPILILSIIGSMVNIFAVPKTEWNEIAAHIIEQAAPNDVVIINPRYLIHPTSFYAGEQIEYLNQNFSNLEQILTSDDLGGYERVWYIEQPINNDTNLDLKQLMFDAFQVQDKKAYYRADLYLMTP